MDEVGQLLTSQIPSCSTASEDESGFIKEQELSPPEGGTPDFK